MINQVRAGPASYGVCSSSVGRFTASARHIVSGMPNTMGGQRVYLELLQMEHRRIVEAIRNHDPKGARDAMRRHLTRSLERYRKLAAEQKRAA